MSVARSPRLLAAGITAIFETVNTLRAAGRPSPGGPSSGSLMYTNQFFQRSGLRRAAKALGAANFARLPQGQETLAAGLGLVLPGDGADGRGSVNTIW